MMLRTTKRIRKRRAIAAAVFFALVVGSGYLGATIRPYLSVGLAYKAKTLCSEIFVAGRSLSDVKEDLAIDDLRPLRLIRTNVDTVARVSSARFLAASRKARFNGELGCTLEPWPPGSGQKSRQVHPAATHGKSAGTATSFALERVLDDAFAEADSGRLKRTRAVVVVQRGEVVAERYAPGIGPDTPLPGWSMAKSVLNALVGAAVREGTLTLDDPTELDAWSAEGDGRGRITASDLLRMSSGLDFDEEQTRASSDVIHMLYAAPNMAAFASSKALVADPGSVWSYSSGSSLILSQMLRERLGDEPYHSFPRRALFEPLGFTGATLEVDSSGTFVASSYMYATAREWARFGELYLQDGVWRGQRILPEGWVAYSTTPAPADALARYGAHFWLSAPREYRGPGAVLPPGVFHAVGHEAQFVTIVPSHDVVIVRLGKTRYPGAWQHDRFVAAVLAALRP